MSDDHGRKKGPQLLPTGIAELHEDGLEGEMLPTMSGMTMLPRDIIRAFSAAEDQSAGFKFLSQFGPRAVRAFKLLKVAQSKRWYLDDMNEVSESEEALLAQLIGQDFVTLAREAYLDCVSITKDTKGLGQLDERTAWRLTEFIHLYDNVMTRGRQQGTLTEDQGEKVYHLLVRDFGEYFGLLCDDSAGAKHKSVSDIIEYLQVFRYTPFFKEQLPLEQMTRLPFKALLSRNLLDYEISRGLDAHSVAVKERIVRGDDTGALHDAHPVEFHHHELSVYYARELEDEGRAIVNAILPVFAISSFDGFSTLDEVEAYIEERRDWVRRHERECFALLQCLKHYGGQVPDTMKAFRASDVMKAAQKVYRRREKDFGQKRRKAITAGGMLKERLTGAVKAVTKPITFSWPSERKAFTLPGYPENLVFFTQKLVIREASGEAVDYTFLCHADRETDPAFETPRMFEYQVVLSDTLLFDAHAALRDLFANVPLTFQRTLDAGPVVIFAKKVLPSDGESDDLDNAEVKLLGTYVALNGGMRSWVGQHYILSRRGANVFINYPDVQRYMSRALPGAAPSSVVVEV